ncbi:ABC transporter ATP-binding protein [Roseinatronobacter sp. NSM]|uniref:ABC transporter ATP-binding protein n=1 Tax=Roseinatronobacter sp. NSM TaxID=3457785 RepID=UPI0040351B9E
MTALDHQSNLPKPVLELRDVSRSFPVKTGYFGPTRMLQAVRGVTLNINRGDVLALVGESGCGKTTLARMLMGVLEPTQGQILHDGKPISGRPIAERSRHLQAVFQDPYSSLNPRKTIGSIVSLPLRVHRQGDAATIRAETLRIMDMVGLPARFFDSYPNQLSGGQRQRVAIARALILKPEIMICDEPTSALDVSVQSQILNLLMDLRRELNLTYVLISHNLAVIEHMATQVAVMYLGRIVESGDSSRVFAQPRHPYTQALLASVMTPDPGLGIPEIDLGVSFPNALAPPSGCAFHPRCSRALPQCSGVAPAPVRDDQGLIECHLHSPAAHPV